MEVNSKQNSVYITTDGVRVDDNDNESIIIYRPISKYITLEDVKIIDNAELPKLKTENLILKKDEYCCFIDNCNTFETTTKTVGYTGNNSGFSYRVGKGLTVNSGGRNSTPIRENYTNYYSGTIYITNKRIVYTSSGNDSFDKPIEKITSVNEFQEGIIIQIGSKKHIIVFDTHALFMLVLGIVRHKEFGTELPEALTNKNVHFTCDPYILELQNKKKKNNNVDRNKVKKSNNTSVNKVILTIFAIFFGLIIIGAIGMSSINSNYENYTDKQIVNLESHPKIFSNFEEAVSFYKTVDRKKVKVSKSHVYYEDDEKHLIYMEIDTNNIGLIDDIRIYLNTSSEYTGIDLNDAIKIAIDYLPIDTINTYYDFYDSFKDIKQNSDTALTAYYYHWKINENGIDYAKNNGTHLSNEIGFKIFYNETNKTCRIYIGSTAISIDEHVRYLDKKCEDWNININDYIEN